METPLSEVHPTGDPRPDIPVPTDIQLFFQDNLGEYDGSLEGKTPSKDPLPFRCQYFRDLAPHRY